ncbi:MAG TPA: NAD-dependent epimerase [Desulfomonilia bacterium]
MKFLVTGSAGFIGFHLSRRLLEDSHEVFGIDNINDYYDPRIKLDRLGMLKDYDAFIFEKADLVDRERIPAIFKEHDFDVVVNLAAQAGVRYSIKNPFAYIDSNIAGFMNILECCRHAGTKHLVYASSSSVYGINEKMPFSVHDNVDHPISIYAVSKKTNELMAHCYSSLYGLPTTGLRFFTVYGPWGRPDMALFMFTKAILAGEPIDVYNNGKMIRDFTYIDDIVEGIVRIANIIPKPDRGWDRANPDPGTSFAPYRVFNIGGSSPVELMRYIEVLEEALGRKAVKNMLPMQPGDVAATCADAADLENVTGFRPQITVEEGIKRFVKWYREYYQFMAS